MKKFLFFTILLALTLSFKWSYSQIDCKNWAKATVDYYKEPRLLIGAHVTPVIGLPFAGIFYGIDANVKVAKILYVNGGFLAPIIDLSSVLGGENNYSFYGGGELVMWKKRSYTTFKVITGGGSGYTTYRDYDVKTADLTILRFGAEYYTNSHFSTGILTIKKPNFGSSNDVITLPNGSQISHAFQYNCQFFYLGIARKSNQYLGISMSDYKNHTDITKFTLTMYFDLFYTPFLSFPDFAHQGVNYKFGDYYRIMPYGGRMGFEAFNVSGKYVGFYSKIEFGMMPGIGLPAYFKIGIGVASIYTKMKSIGNELK